MKDASDAPYVELTSALAASADPRVRVILGLTPAYQGARAAGPAYPVLGRAGDNLTLHRALATAPAGAVIMAKLDGATTAGHWGELMSVAALGRRLSGAVLDTTIRDRMAIEERAFPVFHAGTDPRPAAKSHPGELNVPIQIGGVLVEPGDVVCADADGIAVIPSSVVDVVLEAAARLMAGERLAFERVAGGETTVDVLGLGPPDVADPALHAREAESRLRTTRTPPAHVARVAGERLPASVPRITAHAEVKAAARDWETFSSDLQGERDVRTYRQLPLEVDPPLHRAYRDLLTPTFGRTQVAALEPEFRGVARELIGAIVRKRSVEAVHDLALPMATASIGVALGRRQDEEEYRSWGIDIWRTLPDGTRDGSHLDAYLGRVFDEVIATPGTDVFSAIAAGTVDGRPLNRLEMLGVGNLILAGGRDTIVEVISGAIWYLARYVDDRRRLAADLSRIPAAIDELLRYFSPLLHMERILTRDAHGAWGTARYGDYVLLGFAEANHDRTVFDDPATVRLDRRPNPHVAFGNGPHTCIGVHLARLETRVFLEELLAIAPDWRLGPGADIDFATLGGAQIPTRFEALPIEVGR